MPPRATQTNPLDEFGLAIRFVEWVSDTFLCQTDVVELNSTYIRFRLYNYNDETVGKLLEHKLAKIVTRDPRITYHIGVTLDYAVVTFYFPHPDYRTKRALAVYDNLRAWRGLVFRKPSSDPRNFTDIVILVRHLEDALGVTAAYAPEFRDLSRTKMGAKLRIKTGPKP